MHKSKKEPKEGKKSATPSNPVSKSKLPDLKTEALVQEMQVAKKNKSAMRSSYGNIVASWETLEGSWGISSYPRWDYTLSEFKEDYLMGVIDKYEVRHLI
jgi:hypothetical protein